MPEGQQKKALLIGGVTLAAVLSTKPLYKRLRLARVPLYKLKGHGVEVHISALGGIIQRLLVIDAHGKTDDIVLGYDAPAGYLNSSQYFGAAIGRVANRIGQANFKLHGVEYKLAANDKPHHLHGGKRGWDKVVWKSRKINHHEGDAVELTYTSKDGEEGYPGTVKAKILYILQPNGTLKAIFEATSDKTTPVNMVQHSYFNLAGHNNGDILNHRLQLTATNYTPKDETGLPTGEILPVEGTAFDFTECKRIGSRIEEVDGGYDHNLVLFGMGKNAKFATHLGAATAQPKLAAQLEDPKSGRVLKVLTTAPGLQLYTGNFLEGVKGKEGAIYNKHAGVCLETQGFPNAVNEPSFPSVLLEPGETYNHEVIYQFSIK